MSFKTRSFLKPTGFTLSAIALALLAGCSSSAPVPAGPPPAMPPTQVTTVAVVTRDVPEYFDAIGKCTSPEVVSILSQVSGRITGIHFTEGTDVKKGDLLFTIDPRPFQAVLDQAKADLELNKASVQQSEALLLENRAHLSEMQANLAQNKSRQELYISEFNRAKDLLASNAVAKQEFDSKQMTMTAGESQLKSDQANIEKADAQIRQGEAAIAMGKAKINASLATIQAANINLEYTTIVSPIDGRTGQRLTDLGNVVMANTGNPMLVIQRMDPVYTDFTIPESELTRVRASMAAGKLKVQCWIPQAPDKIKEGEVSFLDTAVQENTGTLKLRATIANSDRYFWPGQFVKVRLLISTMKDTPLVPLIATQLSQAGNFVYVVKADSTIELRPAKLGQRHGDLVVVEGNAVKSGEKIVTTGQMMLYPGAKVSEKHDDPKADAPKTDAHSTDASKPETPAKAEPERQAKSEAKP